LGDTPPRQTNGCYKAFSNLLKRITQLAGFGIAAAKFIRDLLRHLKSEMPARLHA
jgi:hypothetical protein